jgi:hypothetical protein
MATIERGNWSFREPGDDIPDGSTINDGNFTQAAPGTEILVGKTLTINGGNWTNVQVQPTWTVQGGGWVQVSRCTHVHPGLVAHGLDECAEDCSHVVDTDEIYVDGELVDTVYHYADTPVE